jgi:hypothetical protein
LRVQEVKLFEDENIKSGLVCVKKSMKRRKRKILCLGREGGLL